MIFNVQAIVVTKTDARLGAKAGPAPRENVFAAPGLTPFHSKLNREVLGLDSIDERTCRDSMPSKYDRRKSPKWDFFKVEDVCANPRCQHRIDAEKKSQTPPLLPTNVVGLCPDCCENLRVGEDVFDDRLDPDFDPDFDQDLEELVAPSPYRGWHDRFEEEAASDTQPIEEEVEAE